MRGTLDCVLPHTLRRAYVRELGNIELAQVEGVEGIYLARVDDLVADGDDCTDDEGDGAKTAREARAREWILNERVLGGAKLGEVRCGTEPTVCWEGQRGAEGGAREAQAEARGPSRSHTDHGYCRRTRIRA